MEKREPFIFTGKRLLQAIELNADAVSYRALSEQFGVTAGYDTAFRNSLERLMNQGHVLQDRRGYYVAKRPISDVAVARLKENTSKAAKRYEIELKIDGLPDGFPYKVVIKRSVVMNKLGRDLRPDERIAVKLSRTKGTELRATSIIGDFSRFQQPVLLGHLKKGTEHGTATFLPYKQGISTQFAVKGDLPSTLSSRAMFSAKVPFDIDPYNPHLNIQDQRWDPVTGRKIHTVIAQKYGVDNTYPRDAQTKIIKSLARPLNIHLRRDLTHEKILVIDPEDARDHDDGIMIERLPEGFRTLVVVSDVPHYVRPGSTLDKIARQKGFTHYFPDQTYHMLPPSLVEQASLVGRQSRPVIYVEQFWDLEGSLLDDGKIGAGIIMSQRQMTYGQFDDAISSKRNSYAAYVELGDILIEKMRFERVNFDIDENLRPQSYSQMLVSSLMIEANTAIADFLIQHNIPFPSRAHTGNDNIYDFMRFKKTLEDWGYDAPHDISDVSNDKLRLLIQEAERRHEKPRMEREVKENFLNAAMYSVIPYSHFGLNRTNYTHATSPIRRYPDILSLRGVHTALGNDTLGLSEQDMEHLKETCDEMNRLQNIGKKIALDTQRYYAIRDLQRLEGCVVRATMGNIDRDKAEIILHNNAGLRHELDLSKLPENWRFHAPSKSLVYKNSVYVTPRSPIKIKICDVKPDKGLWNFTDMRPAPSKQQVFIPAKPALTALRIA